MSNIPHPPGVQPTSYVYYYYPLQKEQAVPRVYTATPVQQPSQPQSQHPVSPPVVTVSSKQQLGETIQHFQSKQDRHQVIKNKNKKRQVKKKWLRTLKKRLNYGEARTSREVEVKPVQTRITSFPHTRKFKVGPITLDNYGEIQFIMEIKKN